MPFGVEGKPQNTPSSTKQGEWIIQRNLAQYTPNTLITDRSSPLQYHTVPIWVRYVETFEVKYNHDAYTCNIQDLYDVL